MYGSGAGRGKTAGQRPTS